MAVPSGKRQRRLVVPSSDDELAVVSEDDKNNDPRSSRYIASRPTAARSLAARPKRQAATPSSRLQRQASSKSRRASTSSPEKKRKRVGNHWGNEVPISETLHHFFEPATEEQRWSSQRFSAVPSTRGATAEEIEDTDDVIEDDYDSLDEILFPRRAASRETTLVQGGSHASQKLGCRKPVAGSSFEDTPLDGSTDPSKRFPISAGPHSNQDHQNLSAAGESLEEASLRPWADRYPPSDLDELAVHKKKVADVQNWLVDVFAGRSRRRILVLRGPAGSGKTVTISLLAKVLGYDVIEWRSPLGSEYATEGYTPFHVQFDDFLARSNKFGGLELDHSSDAHRRTVCQAPLMHRVILIEEFPGTVSQASPAVTTFRASLLQYLASSLPLEQITSPHNGNLPDPSTPIVIIVTETLLNTVAAVSDNFTVQRLLGTELCNHPGTTIIEFNRIAPTFMLKALSLVLKKEARHSNRRRHPGPDVLSKYSELGDIRSAISALEFFCLRRADEDGALGRRIVAKTHQSKRNKMTLTEEDRKSLEVVTQREASLGIFHAVGKVVYNKREDKNSTQETSTEPTCLAQHLRRPERPKISQVSVDDLINETGTDVQTFISTIHENYVPSCDGASFTDCVDECIQALSESDILGFDSRNRFRACQTGVGTARAPYQGSGLGADRLRQEEISFQIAVRGLLFSLPYPVKRRLVHHKGSGRVGDAYKMYFPTSLRLWKEIEELEGLIDVWQQRLLEPTPALGAVGNGSGSKAEGVASWKSRSINGPMATNSIGNPQPNSVIVTRMSREDMLLQQLPYMSRILGGKADVRELERVTQFQQGHTQSDKVLDEDLDHLEDVPSQVWNVDRDLLKNQRQESVRIRPAGNGSLGPIPTPLLEEAAEMLILSDDDIEDD